MRRLEWDMFFCSVRLVRIASIAVLASLSACVFAPGMKMSVPATVTLKEDVQGPRKQAVPVHEIDVDLIRRQQADRNEAVGSVISDLLSDVRPYTYIIGVGDVLQITVWDHPELATALANQPTAVHSAADPVQGFVVDQGGNIQFPYVRMLHVAGLTPEEAQRRFVARLSSTYRNPQVTLRVGSYRSKSVYVEGEVKVPGLQQLNDIPMTLTEAVNRAGGFTPDANQGRLTLLRSGISYQIDVAVLIGRNVDPSSILLKKGDLLRVAGREDNPVFVMGEVTKPSAALPMKDGRLSLSQALAQVGSINSSTADAKELYVVRGTATGNPQVFHLDAHSPVAMTLANDFQLQDSDVVYVDGNGLVRLSRVISLLLPSANTGMAAAAVAK